MKHKTIRDNHVEAKDCECIFNIEVNYYFKTVEDEVLGNPTFYKDATLVRTCHNHERVARDNILRVIKKEEKKDVYLNCVKFIKDYENEIKIAKYKGVAKRNA